MRYVELRYELAAELAELASEALLDAGATGLEVRDGATIDRPGDGRVVVVVWIEPDEVEGFVSRATSGLTSILGPQVGSAVPARVERDEDEWRDAWKRYFHARPIGRFVIVPSWEQFVPSEAQIVLDLDPGRAFGTGGHASTRLCLLALDQLTLAPTRALDVGCGSGVLAIAAARRWPQLRGEGIDLDADAIEVSRENAERNRVADRLRFSTRPLAELEGRADLILANIQPEVLIPMAPLLVARLAVGGALVLAGIVDEAATEVERVFTTAGLAAPHALHEEGWTALLYRAVAS
jgi:ribosomal protein L11 methyltransferase